MTTKKDHRSIYRILFELSNYTVILIGTPTKSSEDRTDHPHWRYIISLHKWENLPRPSTIIALK